MKIGFKIFLIIGILTILSLSVSGLIYYLNIRQSLSERIGAQLESVSILKKNQINDFLTRSVQDIEVLSANDKLMGFKGNPDDKPLLRSFLITQLSHQKDFYEYFVIDLDRQVDVSTNISQEGKFKSSEPYFNKGKSETFVQSFYYDTSIQKPAITIAVPVKDKSGKTISVLAGRVNLDVVSGIMTERTGLGESGETYLVNKYNLVVTDVKGLESATLKTAIYTDGVRKCLNTESGYSFYKNYQAVPVIGFYSWIPERDICFLAEISQREAMASIGKFINIALIAGGGLFILIILLGTFLSKIITKPIIILRDASESIKQGNFNTSIRVSSNDEIGQLTSSFNQMTLQLFQSHKDLEEKVKERTTELAKKIKELEDVNGVMVGRELKMVELKEEINRLRDEIQKLRDKVGQPTV